MSSEEIDRILSRKGAIVPSSGFVDSVMHAVRSEASTPGPIPFPWRRAWPGLLVAGLAVVAVVVLSVVQVVAKPAVFAARLTSAPELRTILETAARFGVGWILLALLVALVSAKFSMRLAGT